jgi:hypothetical protein
MLIGRIHVVTTADDVIDSFKSKKYTEFGDLSQTQNSATTPSSYHETSEIHIPVHCTPQMSIPQG